MKDVDEPWFFKDILDKSDDEAKKLFVQFKVLPKPGEKVLCWECGSRMLEKAASSASKDKSTATALRCPTCRDTGRHALQLVHPELAWSVWWVGATRAYLPQYKLFFAPVLLHRLPDGP